MRSCHCRWTRISTRILDSPLRERGGRRKSFSWGHLLPRTKRASIQTASARIHGRCEFKRTARIASRAGYKGDLGLLRAHTAASLREHISQQKEKGEEEPANKLQLLRFPIRAAAAAEKGEEEGGMAEHKEETVLESVMDKISEKFHGGDSSSDSDDEKKKGSSSASAAEAMKAKIYRLFGRERPIHSVLGGGKPADLVLWRNKKISGGVLAGATAIWLLFEVMEYHLLTLVCHCLILSLAILFLWSNASTFINKSPPNIPEVKIPEDVTVNVALSLRYEINRGFATLREIGHGRDLKKFLIVIAGFWLLSVLGSCCNFLTLFYIVFVVLYTVPVLYEKYEDKVDAFGEKAMIELKKYYAIFDEKCLSKIPKGPLKDKKH